jgi:Effector-associated domain 1
MIWPVELIQLRELLANLYSDVAISRTVVACSGLDSININFNGRARTNWQAILEEALKHKKIEALITCAATDFPAHKVQLSRALLSYHDWVIVKEVYSFRRAEIIITILSVVLSLYSNLVGLPVEPFLADVVCSVSLIIIFFMWIGKVRVFLKHRGRVTLWLYPISILLIFTLLAWTLFFPLKHLTEFVFKSPWLICGEFTSKGTQSNIDMLIFFDGRGRQIQSLTTPFVNDTGYAEVTREEFWSYRPSFALIEVGSRSFVRSEPARLSSHMFDEGCLGRTELKNE